MEKVKVVQLIHGFSVGGAENLVKQYCLLFDKEVVTLLVIALNNYHSIFDKELKENGINVIYINDIIDEKFLPFPITVKKIFRRIFRKRVVRNVVRNFNPDVIHYHLALSEYVKYINPGRETKIYLTVHSDPKKLWSGKKERIKDRKATEWLVKNKKFRFISLQKEMQKQINDMFQVEDTLIVKNGILLERFISNVSSGKRLKEMLNIPKSAVVIGHIGRFVEAKNHRFLLNIFEKYLEINENATLVLIGTGELKEIIERMALAKGIEDKVYFLGTRSDTPELLHIMNAMVFPSLYEGLPVTLIEAQVAEVPCLVSDQVSEEAGISNIIYFKSLQHTAESWAKKLNEIIQYTPDPAVDYKEWDLKNIVRNLEKLYVNGEIIT